MGFDDLPARRRAALLWHHARAHQMLTTLGRRTRSGEPFPASIETYVKRTVDPRDSSCSGSSSPNDFDKQVADEAWLGSDGRFHLVRQGVLACGGWRNNTRIPYGEFVDDDWCEGYRVRWNVKLVDERQDPTLVPEHLRCRNGLWPPPRKAGKSRGRLDDIRDRLIDELGSWCQACGFRPGIHIDHDYFSGMVRGLLCGRCNAGVDSCGHIDHCPWAIYLNNPPARYLQIPYPRRWALREKEQDKVEYLGWAPAEWSTWSRARRPNRVVCDQPGWTSN